MPKYDVEAFRSRAIELRNKFLSPHPQVTLAEEFGIAVGGSVNRAVRKAGVDFGSDWREKYYKHLKEETKKIVKVRIYKNEELKFHFDDLIIWADPHVPCLHEDLFVKMLQIAERFKIRRLLIPGDFIDYDVLYPRDTGHERRPIKDEVVATRKILDILGEHFELIIWTMGNHDIRLMKLIQRLRRQIMAQKGGAELLEFLSKEGIEAETPFGILNSIFARPGLKIHEASYARIRTSKGDYLVMHPRNISQVGPQSARRYVEKYRASCLCAHSHLWAIGTDRSGIDLAVDLGATCDPDKVNYYWEELGTFPATVPAFSMIRNGTFYSFTLNQKYTDWDFWLA